MTRRRGAGRRQDRILGLALALITVFFCLGMGEFAFRLAMPGWRDFDSGRFLDSTHVPGFGVVGMGRSGFSGRFAQNDGDFNVGVEINTFGLRDDEPVEAAAGRAWMVGDSFAFGWGVEAADRFTEVAGRISGRLVYNVASPGTDVCGYQALIAHMPAHIRPSAVVVALTIENDLHPGACMDAPPPAQPAMSSFLAGPGLWLKTKLTSHSAIYNVAALALKRSDVVRRALVAAGVVQPPHVYQQQRFDVATEQAVTDTMAELARIRTLVPDGIPMAVLLVPGRFDIRDGDAYQRKVREVVAARLATFGITVLDPAEALTAAGFGSTHFAHDGHWSAAGHGIAGTLIGRWLAGLPHDIPLIQ